MFFNISNLPSLCVTEFDEVKYNVLFSRSCLFRQKEVVLEIQTVTLAYRFISLKSLKKLVKQVWYK